MKLTTQPKNVQVYSQRVQKYTKSSRTTKCKKDMPTLNTDIITRLTALCPGLPGWSGTRKVKPIWILLTQETVSGSGISWAVCKSAPRSRQTTTPAPHHHVQLVREITNRIGSCRVGLRQRRTAPTLTSVREESTYGRRNNSHSQYIRACAGMLSGTFSLCRRTQPRHQTFVYCRISSIYLHRQVHSTTCSILSI